MELGVYALIVMPEMKKNEADILTGARNTRIVALLLGAFLGACTADTDTALVGKLLMQQITGGASQRITLEQAAAVPFATMGLRLGSGPEAMLVLGSATPQELDWYAGDQVVVITRMGRVIRTVGLPYDLGGAHAVPASSADGGPSVARETVFLTDFPDLGVFGARIRCTETVAGNETIQILGTDIAVRHDVDHCVADTMDWHFDNNLWRDPQTGYIWRSSQYIHPKSPPLILEVLRPEQNRPG